MASAVREMTPKPTLTVPSRIPRNNQLFQIDGLQYVRLEVAPLLGE